MLPLWAGFVTQNQANSIMSIYREKLHSEYGILSLAKDSPGFNAEHWFGAVWPEFNYIIVEGMKAYGFNAEATEVISNSRKLYALYGPSEYYHPFTGEPHGYRDYIWGNLMAMPGQ